MINSFIKTPKELLEYGQNAYHYDNDSTFKKITKTVNWIFGNYAIIMNSTTWGDYIDSYRIWDQSNGLYYYKGRWDIKYYEELSLFDALGHIYRNDLGQYYVL